MIIDITGSMVYNPAVQKLCTLPYPGHRKGCPNYGKSPDCPPSAPMVNEVYDLSARHWFCILPFNLAAHAARVMLRHPNWSEKQARCCLYWQPAVKKALKAECRQYIKVAIGVVYQDDIAETYEYHLIPEALGVDVFATCARHHITIDRNPTNWVYKIALIAKRKGAA